MTIPAVCRFESLYWLLVIANALNAQFGTGEISGIVADPSGASVARAEVKVRNEANGQTKTVRTDDQGRYTALDLLAGSYTVDVNAQGFKAYVRTGVALVT